MVAALATLRRRHGDLAAEWAAGGRHEEDELPVFLMVLPSLKAHHAVIIVGSLLTQLGMIDSHVGDGIPILARQRPCRRAQCRPGPQNKSTWQASEQSLPMQISSTH